MALSGQTTVATAGTAVALGDQYVNGPVAVKALTTNTKSVYIGNDDNDVTSTTGFELAAGDVIIYDYIGHLGSLKLDSVVNGEGVSWAVLTA